MVEYRILQGKGTLNHRLTERPFETFVLKAPLSRRAWCYQERILSPRIVHFARDQLYWECDELIASEALPHDEKSTITRPRSMDSNLKQSFALIRVPDLFPALAFNPYRIWYTIVEQYTEGELTHESDRLIAISGNAKQLHAALSRKDSSYLADIFSPDIMRGLSWELFESSFSVKLRVPSWSWGSVNAPVHFRVRGNESDGKTMAELVKADTFPSENYFGPIRAGCLRIKASLCRTRLLADRFKVVYKDGQAEGYAFHDRRTGEDNDLHEGYLLQLSSRAHWESDFSVSGLILRFPQCKGAYQRVGVFHSYSCQLPFYREACSTTVLEPQHYVDSHGDGQYTVDIV